MKYLMILTVGVCLLVAPVLAEQQTAPLKPGPEHERLGYFEGEWTCKNNRGDGGGSVTYEWIAGGFFMKGIMSWKQPSGATYETHDIMGYNPHEKFYTWSQSRSSNGMNPFFKGWIKDKTWTWIQEDVRFNDKLYRVQATMTETSPDSWTIKREYSEEGGPWTNNLDATCTKVKATTN